MMKRVYLFWGMLCALCVCLSVTSRAAWAPPQEAQAQMLYNLGLFKGTEQGFELERVMTRGEAAVMLVRLLGAEEQALEQNNACPYADVPAWCQPYVGWLHANKLTNGTSPTTYSPQKDTTYEQYELFLNRALGCEIGRERVGFVAWDKKPFPILRGEAVNLSCLALKERKYYNDMTLTWDLIFKGVLTEQQVRREASQVSIDMASSMLRTEELGEEGQPPRFYIIDNMLFINDPITGDKVFLAEGIDHTFRSSWEWGYHIDGYDFILQFLSEEEFVPSYKILKYNESDRTLQEIIPKWEWMPSMWAEKEEGLYIGGWNGLYLIQPSTGEATQISTQAISGGYGGYGVSYIFTSDGLIVMGPASDWDTPANKVAYIINDQGEARELYPGVFKKANTNIDTLVSFDGETLTFTSMFLLVGTTVPASEVLYWYEYQATAEGVTCIRFLPDEYWEGFRDWLGFKGDYKEFMSFMLEVEQKRIAEGSGRMGIRDYWDLTGVIYYD